MGLRQGGGEGGKKRGEVSEEEHRSRRKIRE
jgi:hypothetical protein